MAPTLNSKFDLVKAAEELLGYAKMMVALAEHGSDDDDHDLALRRAMAQIANKIAFETAPKIDLVKADWIVLADVAAWNIFIDWKAFDHIPLYGHISIADLARALDAHESLVARIASQLLATGKLLPGPSPNTLSHSRISPLYVSVNPVSALCTVAVGNGMKPYAHWPEYFRKYGRHEPVGQTHTPFSFGWGQAARPPWEVKALDPAYASAFAKSMKSREIVGGETPLVGNEALVDLSWVGVEARQMEDYQPVVVDVGGGLGQLLRDVLRDVEGVRPRQCVLQDREEVIEEAMKGVKAGGGGLEGVMMMVHDFHEAQPVKGALVYLLRRILLDYSDFLATGILHRLAAALPPENPKARVIIMEERRLDKITPQNSIVDLVMLNLGGKLRDEAAFRKIAAAAGLKVVGYHISRNNPMCAVECQLA